jgi:hypothetical protein
VRPMHRLKVWRHAYACHCRYYLDESMRLVGNCEVLQGNCIEPAQALLDDFLGGGGGGGAGVLVDEEGIPPSPVSVSPGGWSASSEALDEDAMTPKRFR